MNMPELWHPALLAFCILSYIGLVSRVLSLMHCVARRLFHCVAYFRYLIVSLDSFLLVYIYSFTLWLVALSHAVAILSFVSSLESLYTYNYTYPVLICRQ